MASLTPPRNVDTLDEQGRFHQRFGQNGFGSAPDLSLQEPPPPYKEASSSSLEDLAKEEDETESEYIRGWKLAGFMIALTMACFLVLLDMSVIVTAIPEITTYFRSLPDIGWYGSAYNLSSAALQPLSGKFYTYFNTKWTFLSFLFLFLAGSLICGTATSSMMFIMGRAVAGLGSAGLQNGAMNIIVAVAPLEKRPALMGLGLGGCQMGLAAGPLVGGALTQYTNWRWCFHINYPIGGLAALVIFFVHIPDRRVKCDSSAFRIITDRFDLVGFALFAPWAIMILLALESGGNKHAWNSPFIIGLFVGGALTFVIFFFWERRQGEGAMIPFPVIRKRQIWTSCLSNMFLFTTIFAGSYYLPIYFQAIKGVSPLTSGVYMLPSILCQLVFAIVSGVLTQKIGYYLPFAVVSAAMLAVGNGLMSTFSVDSGPAQWVTYQIIVGVGRGLAMQIALVAIQANTAPDLIAMATSTMVFCQTFGGAIFISVANTIFNNTLVQQLTRRVPETEPRVIIDAGAAGLRDVASEGQIRGVLESYCKGVDAVFYVVVGTSLCMFIVSWGMGWRDIRVKKPNANESTP